MWHFALKETDLPRGSGRTLEVAGQKIGFFNVDGKFYALANACIHRGGPLGDGHLDGAKVTCPWHAWDFDVKTGECSTMPGAKQKTFKLKTQPDGIYVEL